MTLRRPSILATGALAAGLLVAACGGGATTPTTAPASEAPAATEAPATTAPTDAPAATPEATEAASASTGGRTGRIELPDDKVAITLPEGWVEVVLSGDDIDTILSAFPAGTFSDDQVAMMRTAMQSGISLMGFDSSGDGSNINLIVQDQTVPMDLLAPALPGQLETIPGSSDIAVEKASSLGQDALIATYNLTNTLADGSTSKMHGTQLYVSANEKLYIVTVTLADGSQFEARPILDSLESLN